MVEGGEFEDAIIDVTPGYRAFIMQKTTAAFSRLLALAKVEHTLVTTVPGRANAEMLADMKAATTISQLSNRHDPPGHLRPTGPRHDNDHASIKDVKLIPTHDELVSKELPYLPANLMGAPHHLTPGSMEREFDVHFRLLREVGSLACCSSHSLV